MISKLHARLGTAGFILSIVALVAALGGGAYAANAGLSGKQKKEVEKIAKKYAGKPGAAGGAGPAGPKGDAGTAGTNGAAGNDGTSVTNTALVAGNGHCSKGGAEFKVGSGAPTYACNGATGYTETLPAGKSETGAWGLSTPLSGGSVTEDVSVSYNIPLSAAPEVNLILGSEGVSPEAKKGNLANCPGTVKAPRAEPGNLCLYAAETFGPTGITAVEPWFSEASGTVINISIGPTGGYAKGTWAVTAPAS
jgi:hypothetical protein